MSELKVGALIGVPLRQREAQMGETGRVGCFYDRGDSLSDDATAPVLLVVAATNGLQFYEEREAYFERSGFGYESIPEVGDQSIIGFSERIDPPTVELLSVEGSVAVSVRISLPELKKDESKEWAIAIAVRVLAAAVAK